jgi:SAM-dependent methyltransferase
MKNLLTKNIVKYSGLEELLNTEVMTKYNQYIVEQALRNITLTKKVVDFGAGIGTLSLIFRQNFAIDTLCIEVDDKNKEFLSKRKLKHFSSLGEINGDVDLIFSSNVLEHIEDDVSVLKDMTDKLSSNGRIYLYLPAKMLLWSRLDEEVGHYRRYEIFELKHKCHKVGLNIEELHYADSIGFFASLAMKIIGYNKDAGIGSVSSLKFYDKWLFPISKSLDKVGFKYLFGKNIILIATKK